MVLRWCLPLVALCGCGLPSNLVPCGELLCPSGNVCVEDRCATPAQVEACAGLDDGSSCSVAASVGACEAGVCVATGCGNMMVDGNEVCDDGNTISGDGCRADCAKTERCGDAILDEGEGCDDGNANTADGCDLCAPTTWRARAILGANVLATSIGLSSPDGIAAERGGNLYIADTFSNLVRRVDPSGVITTVAGTGTAGTTGDGGPATSAQLDAPRCLAVDGLGNLLVCTPHRIRRIDPAGIITTIAGNGSTTFSGDNGPATSAGLGQVYGVAVDGLGNLFITDANRIRRVDLGGTITTVAGTGTGGFAGDGGPGTSAQLNDPHGIAVDAVGNLFIADRANHRIRKLDAGGAITTVAGIGTQGFAGDGGAATAAQLASPIGVAVGSGGEVFVADSFNYRIRRISLSGMITTIAGTGSGSTSGDGGPAVTAAVALPHHLAVDGAGQLFLTGPAVQRIRRIDTAGMITTVAGTGVYGVSGDGSFATSVGLDGPGTVAVASNGDVIVGDWGNSRVRRVDALGVTTTVAGTGAYGSSGDGGPATSALLSVPTGVALLGSSILVSDFNNYRVRRIDPNGVISTFAGSSQGFFGDGGAATAARLGRPAGLAVDAGGNVYISDPDNQRIRRVAPSGTITTFAGTGTAGGAGDSGLATSAQLSNPTAVAVDGNGNVLVADTNNARIRRIDANGIITTVAGTGTPGFAGDAGPAISAQLWSPTGIAVDASGRILIVDRGNGRVRRVDTAGMITTIGGGAIAADQGDGGPATSALFDDAAGCAVDGAGNVFVAETNGGRIRRIDAVTGTITTIAGAIDRAGLGPVSQASLSDARALVRAPQFTLIAAGSVGTIETLDVTTLSSVIGRYPHAVATQDLARYQSSAFGSVQGVAFDPDAQHVFLTETTSNRLHVVTVADPTNARTWTIAPLVNPGGTAGFADGPVATARLRAPEGLFYEPTTHLLYVADTGNHVVRIVDLSAGVTGAGVTTLAGTPATRGTFGDGGPATSALLYAPSAITRCPNGDVFVADTGNHRVRRVAAVTGVITTVLGDGVAASSGDGVPASTFPIDSPRGLACDAIGNLFVTSRTTVRMLPADDQGHIDGTGPVHTIYGGAPRTGFPDRITSCLTGLVVVDATHLQVVDSCVGVLVELARVSAAP